MLTLLHAGSRDDYCSLPGGSDDYDLTELISFQSDPNLNIDTDWSTGNELFEFIYNTTSNIGSSFQDLIDSESNCLRPDEFAGRNPIRSEDLYQRLHDLLRNEEFISTSEPLENIVCDDFDKLLHNENYNNPSMPLPPIRDIFSPPPPSWVSEEVYFPSSSSSSSSSPSSSYSEGGTDCRFLNDSLDARLSNCDSECDSTEYDVTRNQRLQLNNERVYFTSEFNSGLLQEDIRCRDTQPTNRIVAQSKSKSSTRQPLPCPRRPGRPPKNPIYESSSSDGESEMWSPNNRSTKPRLGGNRSTHLWEFIRRLLDDPIYSPDCIKWENKDQGVWRIVPGKSKVIANLWGVQKKNPKMNFDKLARSLRWCRTYGFLSEVPKNCGYPKKLCFRFGERALEWKN